MVELDFSSCAQKMFKSEKPFIANFNLLGIISLKLNFNANVKCGMHFESFFFFLQKKENTAVGSPSHFPVFPS